MIKELRTLGIDPGLNGGFAIIDNLGRLLSAGHFPTYITKVNGKKRTKIDGAEFSKKLLALEVDQAFVESVSSRPRQAGQFQFGFNTGLIHGVLHALDIPVVTVSPVSWKTNFRIKRTESKTKRDTKDEARAIASGLYPELKGLFSQVKDDGVAEAVLIALYGWCSNRGSKDD